MALLREHLAQHATSLTELLQTPIEIDFGSAQQDLLTRAIETCVVHHDHQPSLAEITRLIQLLDAQQTSTQPTHVEVRWVDPADFSKSTE